MNESQKVKLLEFLKKEEKNGEESKEKNGENEEKN